MAGFLDRLRAVLRREKAEVAESWGEAKARIEGALDRREAELQATPEERLAQVQRDIDASADDLEEIRRRIERGSGAADGRGAEGGASPPGGGPAGGTG
jgi:hypothetical protein